MSENNKQKDAEQLAALVHALIDERKEKPVETPTYREYIELEQLNLPPRSEVHKNSPFRLRFNLHHPFFRFLFILIITVGILCGTYYFLGEQLFSVFQW